MRAIIVLAPGHPMPGGVGQARCRESLSSLSEKDSMSEKSGKGRELCQEGVLELPFGTGHISKAPGRCVAGPARRVGSRCSSGQCGLRGASRAGRARLSGAGAGKVPEQSWERSLGGGEPARRESWGAVPPRGGGSKGRGRGRSWLREGHQEASVAVQSQPGSRRGCGGRLDTGPFSRRVVEATASSTGQGRGRACLRQAWPHSPRRSRAVSVCPGLPHWLPCSGVGAQVRPGGLPGREEGPVAAFPYEDPMVL